MLFASRNPGISKYATDRLSSFRSRLYQSRFLQVSAHFEAFFEIFKLYALLQCSKVNICCHTLIIIFRQVSCFQARSFAPFHHSQRDFSPAPLAATLFSLFLSETSSVPGASVGPVIDSRRRRSLALRLFRTARPA